MDFQMTSETTENGIITWDFFVDINLGIVPFISTQNESNQQAAIAVYLTKDSTPQLEGSGQYVDWLGFITEKISFGEVDSNIRSSLQNAGLQNYAPSYDIQNEKLVVALTIPQLGA